MSHSSSSSQVGTAKSVAMETWSNRSRLTRIFQANENLARCVSDRGTQPDNQPIERSALLGEVDWLCELHNLLYED